MTFTCNFAIEASEGLWDWTYWVKIFNPSNGLMAQRNAYTLQKPGMGSFLSTTATDPAGGTYKCTIDWWINSTSLGQRQAQTQLSYSVPTGETTSANDWSSLPGFRTAYKWRGTLSGASGVSFYGRTVYETDGGSWIDTCWYQGSALAKLTALNDPGSWPVDNFNGYGDDVVGWSENSVSYYRTHARAPCQFEFNQNMEINRPGSSNAFYKTNRLKAGMTSSTVWSERDGHTVSKNW